MNTPSFSSTAFLQKRRFYTVLPVLVCPLLIVFFWLLGGGSATAATSTPVRSAGGLNLTLPVAKLKDDSHLTKMDYYRQADQDSAKHRLLAKNDPYYRLPGLNGPSDSSSAVGMTPALQRSVSGKGHVSTPSLRLHDSDRNEALVYRKLAALNVALAQKAPVTPPPTLPVTPASTPSPDVARLEHLVQTLHTRDTATDPDLRELSGMLDKIMAIQHPIRTTDTVGAVGGPGENPLPNAVPQRAVGIPADSVCLQRVAPTDTLAAATDDQNGFYAVEDPPALSSTGRVIPAVIDETVTVINNSTVPFRLLSSILVNGVLIPTGSLAYGTVQLSGERLTISIKSVQYQQNIFAVSLTVYSPDGLPGIAAPPSVTRDVAKQSADAGVQSLGLTSFDQSLGAQATAAGIQAAKNLFSKKVRLVTVTLPAGYQVLLKDNSQH